MLRIFFSHPARTSLLQDYAFYEVSGIFPFRKLAHTQRIVAASFAEDSATVLLTFTPVAISPAADGEPGHSTASICNAEPVRRTAFAFDTFVVAHDADADADEQSVLSSAGNSEHDARTEPRPPEWRWPRLPRRKRRILNAVASETEEKGQKL